VTTPTHSLLERLRRVDASSLSDADRSLRVLPPQIRPLVPGTRMLGRAVTADSNVDLMSVFAALGHGSPGDVLVIANGGPDLTV
jgi:4-hydroxy-4-methyl-2-oxoglutarate aldolase